MPRRPFLPLILAVLALAGCAKSGSQSPAQREARTKRVLEVLRYKFPELANLEAALVDLKPSEVEGLDEATLVLKGAQGEQKQKIYISRNDRILILGPDPIDASRGVDHLKAERAAEEKRLAGEAARMAEGRPVRGNPAAPVTLVEFSDFQCPYCAQAQQHVSAVLKARGEKVRFVYLHYPLDFHKWAKPAAIASECAARQKPEGFWALHDLYFGRQREITLESLPALGEAELRAAGVDLARWRACAFDPGSPDHQAALRRVDEDIALGGKYKVAGTPTFFINGVLFTERPELMAAGVDKAAGGR